jgi:hypothetical protein
MIRRSILLLMFGLIIVSPSAAQPRRDAQVSSANGWLANLDAGLTQAQKTGKPLMIVVRCVP